MFNHLKVTLSMEDVEKIATAFDLEGSGMFTFPLSGPGHVELSFDYSVSRHILDLKHSVAEVQQLENVNSELRSQVFNLSQKLESHTPAPPCKDSDVIARYHDSVWKTIPFTEVKNFFIDELNAGFLSWSNKLKIIKAVSDVTHQGLRECNHFVEVDLWNTWQLHEDPKTPWAVSGSPTPRNSP